MEPLTWCDDAASLDGIWDFFPGDHELRALDSLVPRPIRVPGLWEAQGYLDLDGAAWYQREFELAELDGFWTLRFGAVMDFADVYLNGHLLGRHELPFTPFEFDVSTVLTVGVNTLAVRVVDPAVDDVEHIRSPHGKQGWAHAAFPSPPSVYLTYGGIWQSVILRRHGPVVIDAVFANGDPDSLQVAVDLTNRAAAASETRLSVGTLGVLQDRVVPLEGGATTTITFDFGAATAPRWSPVSPTLNRLMCKASVDEVVSDVQAVRYGLRSITVEDRQLLIDKTPYRMRSALVQGFASPELYGAQTREMIFAEVEKAKSLGFNTLRLHIKAFEPTYLDVCDELGMFVHCDIPVAEPIAHDELGIATTLTQRAFAAARAQVRRDRNHPSIILWSATNELGIEKPEARSSEQYTEFMRAIVAVIASADPTRPIIENDWIEPDPERVAASPVLTAHWYGRLDQRYLAKLDAQASRAARLARPLFVTELGDWGLPTTDVYERELRARGFLEPPLASELAATPWAGGYIAFAAGTQRYQGLSDRLQIEVLRRRGLGYGLTELTDVPYELNGVLDLARREKPATAVEIRRANQSVLPMLEVSTYCFRAGHHIDASLAIANDGPQLRDVRFTVRLDDFAAVHPVDVVPGYAATRIANLELTVPKVRGAHQCLLELHVDGQLVGANCYPIHVVAATDTPIAVMSLVVDEGALDAASGAEIGARLEQGEAVLLLAQEPTAAHHLPFEATLAWLGTGWDDSDDAGWGSSAYRFTTQTDWLQSLPDAMVLSYEDTTVPPRCLFTSIRGQPWPDVTAVGVYKPAPNPIQGALIGEVTVGTGRLLFCQLPVAAAAQAGDAFALALLGDLLRALGG